MIIRIVKMTFKEDKIPEFMLFLEDKKQLIRDFPGCQMVEILQDIDNSKIIMTHSHWNSAIDLENYRKSKLFQYIWANTKIHFDDKPEAFSMLSLDKL